MAFATGQGARDYLPTIYDNYVTELSVDDKPFELLLADTAGQSEYDRMRPLCYTGITFLWSNG